MKRELCEFYRDRGCTDYTIPGLLAFLRERLPGCSIRAGWCDMQGVYEGIIRDSQNGECPMSGCHFYEDSLDGPTPALALVGKAALEALDGM